MRTQRHILHGPLEDTHLLLKLMETTNAATCLFGSYKIAHIYYTFPILHQTTGKRYISDNCNHSHILALCRDRTLLWFMDLTSFFPSAPPLQYYAPCGGKRLSVNLRALHRFTDLIFTHHMLSHRAAGKATLAGPRPISLLTQTIPLQITRTLQASMNFSSHENLEPQQAAPHSS